MAFNAAVEADRVVEFIRDYMEKNGPDAPIIVGLSGGKDSAAVAAASVAAVGSNRVLGVMLPSGIQKDSADAEGCARFLKIKRVFYNIGPLVKISYDTLKETGYRDFRTINKVVGYNHPSRLRTAILYMIANQIGGRVANTSNLSETYVGYDTKWGDQCGDFSPFFNYTASEIIEIGIALGMPEKAMKKPPADGMCGQTDEERWGFTYADLDSYLRGGELDDDVVEKIERMHRRAAHKYNITLPCTSYYPEGSKNIYQFPALPSWLKAQEEAAMPKPKTTSEEMEALKNAPIGYIYDAEHDRYVKADS